MPHTHKTILAPEPGWGKLNRGQPWGVIAFDLDRALACSSLGKWEAVLVQAVRERGWGASTRRKRSGEPWPDAGPVRINLSELARDLAPGAHESARVAVMRAKRQLVACRILTESEAGLSLNKNADEWARLGPAERAYARAAQPRGGGTLELRGGCNPGVTGVERQGYTPRNARVTGGVAPELHPHIEERARVLDSGRLKKNTLRVCEEGNHGAEGGGESDAERGHTNTESDRRGDGDGDGLEGWVRRQGQAGAGAEHGTADPNGGVVPALPEDPPEAPPPHRVG